MKALFLIAAMAGMLTGCAMPTRDSMRASDQATMQRWSGGDGPYMMSDGSPM